MKKISLFSLLIFIVIIAVIFIGKYTTKNKTPITTNIPRTDITNSTPTNTKSEASNNTTNLSTKYLNNPNINIAKLTFNTPGSPKDSFTLPQVSTHNTKKDCYLIINNNVYNVSSYIGYHPGGSRVIVSRCGKEVTGIFAKIHSNRARDLLRKYKIGTIRTNKTIPISQILTAISNALKKANPNAEIIKVSPKNNFYIAKVIFDGKLLEVHIDNTGHIIKEEIEDTEANRSTWENDNDDK